jgi:hypothetical protein
MARNGAYFTLAWSARWETPRGFEPPHGRIKIQLGTLKEGWTPLLVIGLFCFRGRSGNQGLAGRILDAKPFGELVSSSRASKIDVRAYGNKNLMAPQKTNAMTATIATPKPITVIAKGSYAGNLNMASVSKPQNPPAGSKIKSVARQKFVSANIGRSKRLALCSAKRCAIRNCHSRACRGRNH